MSSIEALAALRQQMPSVVLLVCLVFILVPYTLVGRRMHTNPDWLLATGFGFALMAFWLYRTALSDTEKPIDFTIAAIAGNLIAAALQLRAAKQHARWRDAMDHERTKRYERIKLYRDQLAVMAKDDPRYFATLDKLIDAQLEREAFHRALERDQRP